MDARLVFWPGGHGLALRLRGKKTQMYTCQANFVPGNRLCTCEGGRRDIVLRTQRVLIVYNNMRASTVCPISIRVSRAFLHHGRSHHGKCDQMVDDGESHQLVVCRILQQTFSVKMTADLTLCPLPVSNSFWLLETSNSQIQWLGIDATLLRTFLSLLTNILNHHILTIKAVL